MNYKVLIKAKPCNLLNQINWSEWINQRLQRQCYTMKNFDGIILHHKSLSSDPVEPKMSKDQSARCIVYLVLDQLQSTKYLVRKLEYKSLATSELQKRYFIDPLYLPINTWKSVMTFAHGKLYDERAALLNNIKSTAEQMGQKLKSRCGTRCVWKHYKSWGNVLENACRHRPSYKQIRLTLSLNGSMPTEQHNRTTS